MMHVDIQLDMKDMEVDFGNQLSVVKVEVLVVVVHYVKLHQLNGQIEIVHLMNRFHVHNVEDNIEDQLEELLH